MNQPNSTKQAQAIEVLKKYEKQLKQYEGVYDVGVGLPINGDQMDFNTIAILVYVHKKMSKENLSKNQILPKSLEGIPVDVIESNPIQHDILLDAVDGIFNPLIGGIQIGNGRLTGGGTLGLIVAQRGSLNKVGLTNYHVIVRKKGVRGNPIIQPAFKESNSRFTIGHLHRWNKKLDCAVFEINNNRATEANNSIFNIAGKITQLEEPYIGMRVMKYGATTKLTHGIIASVSTDSVKIRIVPNPDKPAQNNEITSAGDSGSAWVTDEVNPKAVALHWGGDKNTNTRTEFSMANNLKAIFKSLDLVLIN
jgi:endonuclease G